MDTSLTVQQIMTVPQTALAAEPAPVKVRKPRLWTPFLVLVLALAGSVGLAYVVGFVAGAVLDIINLANGGGPEQFQELAETWFGLGTLGGLLLTLLPAQLGMVIVALVAAWLSRVPLRERIGFVRPAMPRFGWLAVVIAPLATVAIGIIVLQLSSFIIPFDASGSPLNVAPTSMAVVIASTLLMSILPALAEELLFRGYIQRRLLQRWSPAVAIGATSMLFALIHFDIINRIPAVLPLGILLGIVAYRSGSIWPAVAVHFLHNLYVGGLGVLHNSLVGLPQPAVNAILLAVLAVGLVIGLTAVLYLMLVRVRQVEVATVDAVELDDVDILVGDVSLSTIRPQPVVAEASERLTTLSA
jgi:membrane protease YdiL (CAAX protease family)